jgi:GGDEF domain-containing protein
LDTFGIERGDVLLSLQVILTREEEQHPAGPQVSRPAAARAQSATFPKAVPPRTIGLARVPAAPSRPLIMVDPQTGAGTLHALRRDLRLQGGPNLDAGPVTAVVAVDFEALDQLRLVLGDEAAEEVVRGLVEVAPFALEARHRVYRSGRDQLILVLPGADDERVEAARWGLEFALGRFLADRKFPEVRLSARRVDPAALAG